MRMSPVGWRSWVWLAGVPLALLAAPDVALAQDDTDAPADDTDGEGTPDSGDDDGEDEPRPVIRLRPPDEHVPSALDDPFASRASEVPPELRGLQSLPRRSTAFVRPRLTANLFSGDKVRVGVGLGATVGQRWWSLEPRTVSWSGENRLMLEGLVGGVEGWRAQGVAAVGPWIGRVGVRFGPLVEVSRVRVEDDVLDPTVLLGGELTVAADLTGVYPWLGLGTSWDLLGRRERGVGLPTLGTETVWQAGLAVQWRWLQPRLEVHARATELGVITTALVGIQLRPPISRRDGGRGDRGPQDATEEGP